MKAFVLTAETGSFSACARKLGKVQSAISQSIPNLEIDLNVQLFDRTTRKPSLTKEGERLLVHAQAVLRQTDTFNSAVESTEKKEEAWIILAVDNALVLPRLSELLFEFGQRFTATSLKFLTCHPE